MSENLVQTVQKVVQDLVAPDVRELKVLITGLQKQIDHLHAYMDQRFDLQKASMDQRFDSQKAYMDQRFDSQNEKSEFQFNAIMAALHESKAQSELISMRVIASLSERVAVLEAQRH